MVTKEQQDIGRAYTKRLGTTALLQLFLQLLGMTAYCYLGGSEIVTQAAERITHNFYLQLVLCWIPIWSIHTACSLAGSWPRFHIDRQFCISRAGFAATLLDILKAKAILFVIGGIFLEIVFASHRISSSFGWIWAGALCSLLLLTVDRFLPFLLALFYPMMPVRDDSLRERLTGLASKAGLRLGKIFEWHISSRTRQANAFVSGVGTARRILLTDTLLNALSQDEVEAIVAHELGHCALHHIAKRIAFQGVLLCGIFWAINFSVMNGLIWLGNEELAWNDLNLVPGILFFYVVGFFYANFLMSALSRGQERAADLYSWKLTGRTAPFITAMRKLQDLNLIVFDQDSQWKHAHPATAERIVAAEQYENKHLASVGMAQGSHQNPIADPYLE